MEYSRQCMNMRISNARYSAEPGRRGTVRLRILGGLLGAAGRTERGSVDAFVIFLAWSPLPMAVTGPMPAEGVRRAAVMPSAMTVVPRAVAMPWAVAVVPPIAPGEVVPMPSCPLAPAPPVVGARPAGGDVGGGVSGVAGPVGRAGAACCRRSLARLGWPRSRPRRAHRQGRRSWPRLASQRPVHRCRRPAMYRDDHSRCGAAGDGGRPGQQQDARAESDFFEPGVGGSAHSDQPEVDRPSNWHSAPP
jgi:hypothetical protein